MKNTLVKLSLLPRSIQKGGLYSLSTLPSAQVIGPYVSVSCTMSEIDLLPGFCKYFILAAFVYRFDRFHFNDDFSSFEEC